MSTLTETFPTTFTRVEKNTPEEINRRIERETEENVVRVSAGGPDAITARLRELDQEWDIERVLEANAGAVALTTLALGFAVDRRWFIMPAFVAGFLLQHALQGWCPPLPIFRRRGVRTVREIELERTALRILRGDFGSGGTSDPREALAQAKKGRSANS